MSDIATYRKIEADLREKIQQGHWAPGTLLPGRRALAAEYGVTVKTLDRALLYLLEDGVLRAEGRRGTFVAGVNFGHAVIGNTDDISQQKRSTPEVSTATIGMVTGLSGSPTQLEDGSIGEFLAVHAMEATVSGAGAQTRSLSHYGCMSKTQAIEKLLDEGVQALAVFGICDPQDFRDEVVRALRSVSIPVLYVMPEPLAAPVPHIYYSQETAGYLATEHLLEAGSRNLLFLQPYTTDWVAERLAGARAAVADFHEQASITVYPENAPDFATLGYPQEIDGFVRDMVDWCVKRWLRPNTEYQSLCGLIAPHDAVAFPLMTALAEQHLEPGRDYRIIGFDDAPKARIAGLTTLRPPFEEMGACAARLLLRALEGEPVPQQTCLVSQVVKRASSK